MMKNKFSKILIAAGSLMILSALVLCISNIYDSRRAARYSAEALRSLKQLIPSEPTVTVPVTSLDSSDLFYEYEQEASAPSQPDDIIIDGYEYCGYISIPSLDIELPVMSSYELSYLKRSPCRFSGSTQTNDLIIAAHNYNSHFGRIGSLSFGDRLIFTDTSGRRCNYTVSCTEYIDGNDIDSMLRGAAEQWDLTLFSCTISGRERVTIRAGRVLT